MVPPGPPRGPPKKPPKGPPVPEDKPELDQQNSGDTKISGPPISKPSGPPKGPPRGPPSSGPPSSGPPSSSPQSPPTKGPPSGPPARGPPSSGPPKMAPPTSAFEKKEVESEVEDQEENPEAEPEEEEEDTSEVEPEEEEEEALVVDSEEEDSDDDDADSEEVVSGGPMIIDRFGTDERKPMEITVEALDALPNRVPLSEAEPDEAPPAVITQPREVLAPAGSVYDDLPKTERSGHIIPYALWPRTAVRSSASNHHLLLDMMDDLLTLLESNEETFPSFDLDGQTLLIEDYLRSRPENRGRIMSLIDSERLNIGPWYNPPAQFLCGSESLIRNLMRGQSDIKTLGGKIGSTPMPRSSSHISQLPALLSGVGSDEVIFSGGAGPWIQDARGVFKWTSPGNHASVLAIKQIPNGRPLAGWGFEKRMTDSKDSSEIDLHSGTKRIEDICNMHLEKYGWLPPMMGFGNSTRHGMAQTSLPRLIAESNNAMKGDVHFEHSSFTGFGKEIRKWVGRKTLYTYDGEMRHGWDHALHSGAISARMYLKRMNDHTVRLLTHGLEPLCAMSWFHGGRNRNDRLRSAWDIVLRNHGSNELGGLGPDSVHMDMEDDFRHAQETIEMVMEDVRIELADSMNLHHIDRDAVPLLINNPLGVEWSGMLPVDLAVPAYRSWLDSGNPVHLEFSKAPRGAELISDIVQVAPEPDTHLHRDHHVDLELPRIRGRVQVHKIPPGIHVLHAIPGHASPSTLPDAPVSTEVDTGQLRAMENGHLRIEFLPDGRFDLIDLATERRFPGIGRLEDVEDAGDAHDHSAGGHPGPQETPMSLRAQPLDRRLHDSDITRIQTTTMLQKSDEWCATAHIRIVWSVPAYFDPATQSRSVEFGAVVIDHFVSLRLGAKTVDVETWVDNQAEDHRLRMIIPTGMHLTHANVGSPFDVVRRPVLHPHDPTWHQPLVPTQPMERFIAVEGTEDGKNDGGFALIAPGVNEYEVVLSDDSDPGGYDLALTLVRSVGWTSQAGFGSRPSAADAIIAAPGAQCMGSSIIRWSLMPYTSGWSEADVHGEAERFSTNATLQSAMKKPLPNGFFDEALTPGTLGRSMTHFRFEGDGAAPTLSCFKPSEDGGAMILRVYNPTETDWNGRIFSDIDLDRVHECSMIENARKKKIELKNGSFEASVPAGAIIQWRLS